MTHLLKAVGFWIWGLLAIVLTFGVVAVSYRMSSLVRGIPGHERMAMQAYEPTREKRGIDGTVKEMTAAQDAALTGDWSVALKNLDAAAAKSPLTAAEKKSIFDLKGFVYLKLQRAKDAQVAYEAAISTGAYSAEELARVDRTLFALAAQNADYVQTIALGTQLANANDASDNDLSIISQAYLAQKDCIKATAWGDRAIAASASAKNAPTENTYLIKLQCAASSGDRTALVTVLSELIRLTHKRSHWNTLLRSERTQLHDDHSTLLIDRLMYDTGAMSDDTDFIELAQLLNDRGNPSEALMVVKDLIASNHLKPEHRDRTERLLDQLTRRVDAETDKLEPDAARLLLLANASDDAAQNFGAPTYLERTATQGQLKRPDESSLYIARVLVLEGDFAGARLAMQKFVSLCDPGVGRLWKLYADTLPEPAPAKST